MTKRLIDAEAEKAKAKEIENCGCKYNWDDKFMEKCEKHLQEEFTECWGEPIDVYSDEEALEDGDLMDVGFFGVKFNGKVINRVTQGAALVMNFANKHETVAANHLQFIANKCKKDREGADAWGIFEPDARLGNEKFWLVGNETGGYTLLLPEEY
jgi:hypothetical protein